MIDDFMYRLARVMRQPFFKIFTILYIIVFFGFYIFTLVNRTSPSTLFRKHSVNKINYDSLKASLLYLKDTLLVINESNRLLQHQIDSNFSNLNCLHDSINSKRSNILDKKYDIYIKGLIQRQDIIENDFKDFKKAINPTDFKDILTVARLGDKFELLNNRISSCDQRIVELSNKFSDEISRSVETTNKQIDRVIDLFKWVGLLLIPILITTVKDIFIRPKSKSEVDKTKIP
jgi:hypothetical protein